MVRSNIMLRGAISNNNLKRPDWTKQIHRSNQKLWLDKNECADPELNKIVKHCLAQVPPETVFSYPELDILYSKIAKFSNVLPENILITAGSDGAIRACFESCIESGDSVILTRPTFAMYEVYCKIYGAKISWLDYQKSEIGPTLNVENILEKIKASRPKMVCLPNPNSPTGTVFSLKDLLKIIDLTAELGTFMLIDEAYFPLYDRTVINYINEYKYLVVVRSFSKAWGAAGLRVGYAVANKKLITALHKQRPMYEVGNVSAKAIELLLDYEDEMKLSVKRVNDGKKFFIDSMKSIGIDSYDSYGNFLHVRFGKYAADIHAALNDKVYYRKDFNEPSLKGYSRFSTTTVERFQPIIKCIKDVIKKVNIQESSNYENI